MARYNSVHREYQRAGIAVEGPPRLADQIKIQLWIDAKGQSDLVLHSFPASGADGGTRNLGGNGVIDGP